MNAGRTVDSEQSLATIKNEKIIGNYRFGNLNKTLIFAGINISFVVNKLTSVRKKLS